MDRYAYDVWGALTSVSESVPQRLRYAGYWYDQELGWYWVSVRMYDPSLKSHRIANPLSSSARGRLLLASVPGDCFAADGAGFGCNVTPFLLPL